jgi:excisionase family DNA binding protein
VLLFFQFMSKPKQYTSQEAAFLLGISDSRIRQLALAGEIDHYYFGRSLVITDKGIKQAQTRKTKRGPEAAGTDRRKAA